MKSFFRRRAFILGIDIVLYCICLIGAYNVSQKAGLNVFLGKKEGEVIVQRVYDKTEANPLKKGDRIYTIQGHPISSPEMIEFVLDGMKIGDTALLTIQRGIEHFSLETVLKPFYTRTYLIIMFIVGSLYFFIGIFVFLRRPDDVAAKIFHWASISVGVIILTTWGNYTIDPYEVGKSIRILFSAAYTFAPAIFLHFTMIFPRRKFNNINTLIALLYSIAGIITVGLGIAFIKATAAQSSEWISYYLSGFDICRIFFSSCVLLAVINVLHSYFTAKEEVDRRKLRWIMLGLIVTPLIFILLWQLPSVLFSTVFIAEELLLIFSSLIPITFAISIVRYHTFDIDLLFRRTTVYTLVFGIILSIYVIVVGCVALVLHSFTITSSIIASAFATVLIALMFEPLRKTVKATVDKKFFRVQYNYREALKTFTEDIRDIVDTGKLGKLIVTHLNDTLKPHNVCVVLYPDSGRYMYKIGSINFNVNIPSDSFALLDSSSHRQKGFPEKIEQVVNIECPDRELFEKFRAVLIVDILKETGEKYGYIILGEKRSGFRYSLEDIGLITNTAAQTGLALDRIYLHRKVLVEQAMAQRYEELSRLKSFFVSSVSHEFKTPLTSIQMFTELLRSMKRISKKKLLEYLDIIEGESERLRRLVDNILDFSKIEGGVKIYNYKKVEINSVVEESLKLFKYQLMINKFVLDKKLSKRVGTINADPDAVLETMMNLLSNAVRYSFHKKHITVRTARMNGYISISISDRGIGIAQDEVSKIFEPYYRSVNPRVQSLGGTGLGLALVKHIMEAHNGRVEVESTPGKGTTVTLLFPEETRHETNSHRRRRSRDIKRTKRKSRTRTL